MFRSFAFVAALSLTAACSEAPELAELAQTEDTSEARFSIELADEEIAAVLELANTASLEVLDDDVALDSRAANGIVERRPLATLEELDAVPYVGDAALAKLFEYAADNGMIEQGAPLVHGIEEGSADAEAVLWVANTATEAQLDDNAGLDSRAAAAIVAARDLAEIGTLEELDALSYVGASAFSKLLAFSVGYEEPCPAGKILSSDGAVFTDFGDAAERSSTGATLTVCPGTFTESVVQINRELHVVGVGNPRIRVDQLYANVDTTWQGLRIDSRIFTIDGPSAHDRTHVLLDNVTVTGETFRLIRASGTALESTFDGLDQIDLNYWSTLSATDSWFVRGGLNDTGIVHVGFAGILRVTGGGFHDNLNGVSFDGSAAHFTDVDFGLGETDNELYDFRGAGEFLTYLHANTTMSCNNFGCNL